MKKPELKIPTLLGIVVVLLGLVAGLWLLQNPIRSFVGASAEETPQTLKITNITDNSFVVSWTTLKSASGFIQYGDNNTPELVVSDDRDQEKGSVNNYFSHYVTVRGLKPNTPYVFRVGSGRGLYDQNGKPYTVTTGPTLRNQPTSDVAYGQVFLSSGDAAEGAIVYALIPGNSPLSALVKSSGSWVIPLSTARTSDLSSFAAYDRQTSPLELFVNGAGFGTANLSTTTGNDSPTQVISLSTSDQTTTTMAVEPTLIPQAEIELEPTVGPTMMQPSPTLSVQLTTVSKFSSLNLPQASENVELGTLEITTPLFGQKMQLQKPTIQGLAPANSKVQITVESPKKFESTIQADANGNWEYTTPEDLTPGEHTVTVKTTINGILKTVKRSFVVEAAVSKSPQFSASPSATLKPTAKPTKKPTPTPTSKTVRVSYPLTEGETPKSGNLTTTLFALILGLSLIGSGLFVFPKSKL